MKKYLRLFLPLLLLTTCLNIQATVTEFEVRDFQEYLRIVTTYANSGLLSPDSSDAICFVDLDDTVLKYKSFVGTEAWFGLVYAGLKDRGISNPMVPMFFAAITAHQMQTRSVELTEPVVPGIFNVLQSTFHIPVIGLTSRTYILSDITYSQFVKTGITLSSPWATPINLNDDPVWKALYIPRDGVVYCSGNNKGLILKNLYDIKLSRARTIFVLDNDQKHLDRIKEAMNHLPINLVLIKYSPMIQQSAPVLSDTELQSYIDFVIGLHQQTEDASRKSIEAAAKRSILESLAYSHHSDSIDHTVPRAVSCPCDHRQD